MKLEERIKLQEAAEKRISAGETPLFLVNTGNDNKIPVKSVDELYHAISAMNGTIVVQMAMVRGGDIKEKYESVYNGDVSVLRHWMLNKRDYRPTFDVQREIWPDWGCYMVGSERLLFRTDKEFLGEFHELALEHDASVKALPYFLGIVFNKAPKTQSA